MLKNIRALLLIVLSLNTVQAFAGGFQQDSSKPTALVSVTPLETSQASVSPHTNAQWHAYDAPIRQCIQGDTILPSSGNDLFSYLFHNNSPVDITLSIKGWKYDKQHKPQCQMNFAEGMNVMACHFASPELVELMQNIVNPDKFSSTSNFAQLLNQRCQPAG